MLGYLTLGSEWSSPLMLHCAMCRCSTLFSTKKVLLRAPASMVLSTCWWWWERGGGRQEV